MMIVEPIIEVLGTKLSDTPRGQLWTVDPNGMGKERELPGVVDLEGTC